MSRINPVFLDRILEAAADKLASEVNVDEVVEKLVALRQDDIDEDAIVEAAARKVADNIDEDNVVEQATDNIERNIDLDAIIDAVVERVTARLIDLLTEQESMQDVSPCRVQGCRRVHPEGHPRCGGCGELEPWHSQGCTMNPYTPEGRKPSRRNTIEERTPTSQSETEGTYLRSE